jgi:hypothetical protein
VVDTGFTFIDARRERDGVFVDRFGKKFTLQKNGIYIGYDGKRYFIPSESYLMHHEEGHLRNGDFPITLCLVDEHPGMRSYLGLGANPTP